MLSNKITYKGNIPYNEEGLIDFDVQFMDKYMKDGILINPNYNPNKPTQTFNKKEFEMFREDYLLSGSIGYGEFSWTLIFELLDRYNFKDTKEVDDLIFGLIQKEVENVT